MRRKSITIPSAFQLLDTQVTAADSFANVRDLQTMRLNHNILLAKRVQPTIFTCKYPGDGSNDFTRFVVRTAKEQAGAEIMRQTIYVPAFTKQLLLTLYCCKSALTGEGSELNEDVNVHAEVWNQFARKTKYSPPSVAVSAAAGSPSKYEITINIPPVSPKSIIRDDRRAFEFGVWASCLMDHTASIAAALAPSAVASRSITVGSAAILEKHTVYSNTNRGIESRIVTKRIPLGGGNYQLFLDKAWSKTPDISVDQITAREIQGLDLYSATLRCRPITDFDQEYEL
jgi:hypothetical protein